MILSYPAPQYPPYGMFSDGWVPRLSVTTAEVAVKSAAQRITSGARTSRTGYGVLLGLGCGILVALITLVAISL
ncbi:hypothetical protein ACWGJP_02620 [Microbacterium sp. NPDC055903]